METTEILILAGGFAGGFVSGLTGFGTGLTALPFWLNAVHPTVAAPLVVVCSIVAQVQTLPAIRKSINWPRVTPFILGGVVGVPIGTIVLARISPFLFKLFIGFFLIIYCSVMLFKKRQFVISTSSRIADGSVGFLGGILGGFAGLSGPLPTIWASLRGWLKDEKRAVFQVYNLTILSLALVSMTVGGFITAPALKAVLIALPGTLVGAFIGRRIYKGLGDAQFNRVVLVVLLISGFSIIGFTLVPG